MRGRHSYLPISLSSLEKGVGTGLGSITCEWKCQQVLGRKEADSIVQPNATSASSALFQHMADIHKTMPKARPEIAWREMRVRRPSLPTYGTS
jgi:hypothetical protein